jgi:hypothetical protein
MDIYRQNKKALPLKIFNTPSLAVRLSLFLEIVFLNHFLVGLKIHYFAPPDHSGFAFIVRYSIELFVTESFSNKNTMIKIQENNDIIFCL